MKVEVVLAQAWQKNARDFIQAKSGSNSHKNLTRPQIYQIKPPLSMALLNVNAAFQNHSQTAGVEGVIRDNEGKWILGFAKTTFVEDALLAELRGIQEGLAIALDHGFKKLALFLDGKMVTQLLDQETTHTNI